ncbi:hypothetical protein [Candidatus Palauibacter sp.]|uniref:hypothetical protein n=1 Tax=Candidatus Palauibacter sp. TaxID=3101350 RepID=UPI003AF23149
MVRGGTRRGRRGCVERLREQVALLAHQVDRLTEERRFMTRLLETGARGDAPPAATAAGPFLLAGVCMTVLEALPT